MDLRDLTTFRTVADEGGITRAAERLGRVQSAVTTRIKNLETDLGRPLFLREPGGMRLTPAGTVLLDYANRLIDLAEEAENAVLDPRPRGTFRLGSMESTAAVRLPPLIDRLLGDWPDVTLRLTTGNTVQLTSELAEGRIDAAIMASDAEEPRFASALAFAERPMLVRRRGACDSGTLLAFEEGCPHRRLLEQWMVAEGRRPGKVIELGSYHAIIGCVTAGMGTALMTEGVLDLFPARDRLDVTPLPAPFDLMEVRLYWRDGAESPAISALKAML